MPPPGVGAGGRWEARGSRGSQLLRVQTGTKLIVTIGAWLLALSQILGQTQKQNQFSSGNWALGKVSERPKLT